MNCILFLAFKLAFGLVNNLKLTSLFPNYQNYDNNPYIMTSALVNPNLTIFINASLHEDIYLNSKLLTTISSPSNVSLQLLPGYNTLTIVDSASVSFLIPYSTCNDFNHSVSLGSTICSNFNCGSTNLSFVSLAVSVPGYSARLFSLNYRNPSWYSINGSLSFSLSIGVNYLQLIYNSCAMSYSIYKVPSNSMAVNIQVSVGYSYLSPIFVPDTYNYQVFPQLDSVTGFVYSLNTTTYANCSITYSSTSGF